MTVVGPLAWGDHYWAPSMVGVALRQVGPLALDGSGKHGDPSSFPFLPFPFSGGGAAGIVYASPSEPVPESPGGCSTVLSLRMFGPH